MSHHHFCDVAGHLWECHGLAFRPDSDMGGLTECVCPIHDVPLDDGDHTECPIELIACPVHQAADVAQMMIIQEDRLAAIQDEVKQQISVEAIGFCLWCNQDFYSVTELREHNRDGMKACPGVSHRLTGLRQGKKP